MSYCSDCPQTWPTCSTSSSCCDHLHPTSSSSLIYQQACYHYQSYLYYWNMYNTQNTHSLPPCECYEYSKQNYRCHFTDYSEQCKDCIDGNFYQTETKNWDEFQTARNEASFVNSSSYQGNQEYSGGDHEFVYDYDDDNDDDDDEFEVDENFYQFLKQSQKHKKEREKSKRELSSKDEYIEVGKKKINASTLPPEEHQVSKRKKAMEELYGEEASLIMSLETAVQLHFDKNFDDRQPIFWPNIPLKF